MTRNRTTLAVGAVVLSFILRGVQITDIVVSQSGAWWALEVARWVLVIGAVALLARAVEALTARVTEHDEKLRLIAAEATLARLELDVMPLGDYPRAV